MRQLMDYLPAVYQGSREVNALQRALEPSLEALWGSRDDLFRQFNVETATWGLAWWEEGLGLEISAQRPMADRRARIRAKLRVRGVTTPEMIRGVAAAYSDGPVTVTEFPPEYHFEVGIVLALERPVEDLPALWQQISEVRPAHLGFFLSAAMPPAELWEEESARLHGLRVRTGVYERGNGIIRLDGAKRLDGSWILDAAWTDGPRLAQMEVSGWVRESIRTISGTRYSAGAALAHRGRCHSVALGASAKDKGRGRLEEYRQRSGIRTAVGGAGYLTRDTMWRLSGAFDLDGTRKLNAEIVRSEV